MTASRRKNIAILGSTGSVGQQALEVIRQQPERFSVEMLSAKNSTSLLIEQAREFSPRTVVIGNPDHYRQVREALAPTSVHVTAGEDALEEAVASPQTDMVLSAMVGISGLGPTINAIRHGKAIALANKETLVVAGHIITEMARASGVTLLPVDSEHSAIYQCLAGEAHNSIEKIYLTASGGPFRGMSREAMKSVTREQALKHPNWDMGAKITIDSASMMNKGLEVIEAKWLFSLSPDQIRVVIHPQSIIHSVVQFEDGSMKAQMGLPDMKLPIQYALGYPERIRSQFERFCFTDYPALTFEQVNEQCFPCIGLAYKAMEKGGNSPCTLNAANEIAVAAFLDGKIGFGQIPEIIATCMERVTHINTPGLEDIRETDNEARALAVELTEQKRNPNVL
ncbi:MAG: 1-deoxy-D-xylulose-5-phosphate reductoisomerase [Bacteroidales bacterium]